MSLGKVLGSLKKATRKVRTEQEHERVLNKFTASRLYVHSNNTYMYFFSKVAGATLSEITDQNGRDNVNKHQVNAL